MRIIKLTETEANKIRGIYKPNHLCEPVKVEDDFYIIHEGIREVPELAKMLDFTPLERFMRGDKSELDLKYKAFIEKNEEDLKIKSKIQEIK